MRVAAKKLVVNASSGEKDAPLKVHRTPPAYHLTECYAAPHHRAPELSNVDWYSLPKARARSRHDTITDIAPTLMLLPALRSVIATTTTTTIWLRRAYRRLNVHEALIVATGPCSGTCHPPLSFGQLQGITTRPRWFEFQRLPGFGPLQRHHQRVVSSGIPAPEPPVPRFSQPPDESRSHRLAGVFQPAGTPRV
jgi:hypothetical protein